jgi:predicted RNA-binding Zn-ribbon protein involved in translation (DUF1610 family)
MVCYSNDKILNDKQWWFLTQRYTKKPECDCKHSREIVRFKGSDYEWRDLLRQLGELATTVRPKGELNPCPKCKGKDIRPAEMLRWSGASYKMFCSDCKFSTFWADNVEEAQDLWNAETASAKGLSDD